jgi:gamma-D-glutamyl-L-lysine dipeptidyl-peptidase
MQKGICIVSCAALRRDPAHEAEMTSQLLFGELVAIADAKGDWAEVRSVNDGYAGWCLQSQLEPMEISAATNNGLSLLAGDWGGEVTWRERTFRIPLGASISDPASMMYTGTLWDPETVIVDEAIITRIAHLCLDTPYLWGGRSVWGIDCSGFTQLVYRFLGQALPRDAWQQATLGEVVDFVQEARCGDLAFFDNADGRIIHTGIVLDAQTIIHAAGRVRIDGLDHQGIVHADTGRHTHRLRILKRVL